MASKILKNYLPELSALFIGRSRPSMLTINLTNQCNQNCIYCEIGKQHPSLSKEALKFEDIIWIIDEMSKNKIWKISFCGGEPFLFAGITDLVAYAGKKHIRCSITTNGMTVHKLSENELNILQKCKTEINISIDSFDENIQSLTRGINATLPNVLKSIKRLSETNIPVTVLTVISKFNYQEIFKFFTTACEKGVEQVLFQPVIYFSNYPDQRTIDNKSQLNISPDKVDELMVELRKILHFERTHTINSNVYRIFPWIKYYLKEAASQDGKWFFTDVLNKFYCRELNAIIDISYDGGIQPCGLELAKISIHNNRNQGLMAMWLEATSDIKNDLKNGKYHPCCNGCCHHFSRNMLASILKYPFKNRVALLHLFPLLFSRILSRTLKKFIFVNKIYGR